MRRSPEHGLETPVKGIQYWSWPAGNNGRARLRGSPPPPSPLTEALLWPSGHTPKTMGSGNAYDRDPRPLKVVANEVRNASRRVSEVDSAAILHQNVRISILYNIYHCFRRIRYPPKPSILMQFGHQCRGKLHNKNKAPNKQQTHAPKYRKCVQKATLWTTSDHQKSG